MPWRPRTSGTALPQPSNKRNGPNHFRQVLDCASPLALSLAFEVTGKVIWNRQTRMAHRLFTICKRRHRIASATGIVYAVRTQ